MTGSRKWLSIRAGILFLFTPTLLALDPDCSDFLALLQRKPAHIEFLECKHTENSAGDSWVARYRVSGRHASEVEESLAKSFGLKKLVKSCCQWDGPAASYRKGNDLFDISMTSDEDTSTTVTSTRADWSRIRFFYITVKHYKAD